MSSSPPTFFARHARTILILVALAFPAVLAGSLWAMSTNHNDVREWLPESFEETQQYNEFQRVFASDTYVLASWDGCTLDDPRLARFAASLAPASASSSATASQATGEPPSGGPPAANKPAPVASAAQPAAGHDYFSSVLTGRALLDRLTSPPINLSTRQAVERLKGSLIGPDGEQTCAVLTVSAYGKEHFRSMLQYVDETAERCGIPQDSLRMAGPPVDNVAIDRVSESMREELMFAAAVVGLGLSWWYMRDTRLALMVFVGGAYSATLCLAIVAITGGTMNSVLFTMPAVVYTAGLSAAVHVVNYYRYARLEGGLEGAPERGLKAGWIPCLLSAGTTALGLISLCTSAIVPIKSFGLYTSIGVMAAVGLIFLYLPAALQVWPPRVADPVQPAGDAAARLALHQRRMRRLGALIIARPWAVFAAFAIVGLAGSAGLYYVRTTVNLMSLFDSRAPIIKSYEWLEEKLGAMAPMEVVLHLDQQTCRLTLLERLELVGKLQQAIERVPKVGRGSMSAVTFVPDLSPPKRRGLASTLVNASVWRSVFTKKLEDHRSELISGDYVAEADEAGRRQQQWRISIRVAALADVDYGQFIHDLRREVDPIVEEERARGIEGIAGLTYTGLVPVVYTAERELLHGLIESFFWAFLMMAGIMSFVFGDVRAGFFTMLPNVWPIAVVFGLMGWLGIALDIGTMMTASVAMGVCVDDMVHFANWFRRATRLGCNRREAVVLAFENSAGAIYQSTVIVAVGLAIFALSQFMPTRRFGYLMGILLFCGLVADLVLSPAMLAGRIGRYFQRNCEPEQQNP